jgi:lipid-A-disaccharide synthase-like uncharacterized protein
MTPALHFRLARWAVIMWAIAIPAPLVVIYGCAALLLGIGAFFGGGWIAALYCAWGCAGVFGFVVLWCALFAGSFRRSKKWLMIGLISAFLSFGAFIGMWLLGLAQSSRLTPLSFWPLCFSGPAIVSLCYLISLPRLSRRDEKA